MLVLNVNRLFIPERTDPQQVPYLLFHWNKLLATDILHLEKEFDLQRNEMWKIRYLFLGAAQLLKDSVLPGANKCPDCFSSLDLGSPPHFAASAPPHEARLSRAGLPVPFLGGVSSASQPIPAWSTGLQGPVLWEIKAQPCLQDTLGTELLCPP